MEELVALLKQARQDRQVTLKEISNQTKIQLRYLEALENNDFSVFAGEVYLKGAICNYAETVGLDTREVLALYHRLKNKEAVEPEPDSSGQEPPRRVKPAGGRPAGFFKGERQGPPLNAGVVVLVVILIAAGAWFALANFPREDAAVEPDPVKNDSYGDPEDGIETVEEPRPAPAVTAQAASAEETVFTVSGFEEIELSLVFEQPCWIQLVADGSELFYPRTFQRGESYTATAAERIWLRMGYPRGAAVTVNGVEVTENRDFSRPHNFVFTMD